MEHTVLDISAIDYGNFILDKWLKNEQGTIHFIVNSRAARNCLMSTYKTLMKLGEMEKFENWTEEAKYDYVDLAIQWESPISDFKTTQLAICAGVLTVMAEKRLKVTSGV